MGVGEVAGADDTGTDSLQAGRETTDWPGHRRQRSWVPGSCGREPDSRRVEVFSGQLFSPRASVLNPPGREEEHLGAFRAKPSRVKRNGLPISALWAPGATPALRSTQ